VAVLGAGIVGAACAYELASSGLRVVVVESGAVGADATNLGYGGLSILDEKPGQFTLTRYGLSLWDRLVEWLPQDCDYRRCGTIWLAVEEGQMEDAVRRGELFNREGIPAELLDRQQLAEAEPGLTADVAGGLHVAADGCLRAERAAEYLFQLALKKGAQHVRQKATEIREHEVKFEDGTLYAGNIVNAAGRDAAALTPGLPIEYSKGHVLVVETQERCARHQISEIGTERTAEAAVRFEARQNETVPNQAGEIWIGSSYQRTTEAAGLQVEPRIVALVLRRAIEMIPGIGRAKPLRSWTGLRTTTVDGLPLIGRMAGKEGIFAAAGHDDYGAAAALATARLIADEILLRTPEIDPTPYRADRFEGTNS
jgi:glycine/D-amino acid oxidase-like deaminating enzyme